MRVLVFKDIKNNRWTLWNEDKTVHLGYRDSLVLDNCKLVVLEDKRQRIVKSKKRFPHAWIVGDLSKRKGSIKKEITYNPFKNQFFKEGIKNAFRRKKLIFTDTGKVYTSNI